MFFKRHLRKQTEFKNERKSNKGELFTSMLQNVNISSVLSKLRLKFGRG